MSDDKKQKVEREKLQENIEKKRHHEHRKDQAIYQPERSELDDNSPPQEDSES